MGFQMGYADARDCGKHTEMISKLSIQPHSKPQSLIVFHNACNITVYFSFPITHIRSESELKNHRLTLPI